MGLPAVVLALVLVLVVASAAVAQVRCTDAARAGARAAALGEDAASVAAIVADLAGDGAQVAVGEAEGWVHVEVSRPVAAGWWGIGSLSATASFAVPMEPGSP